MYNTYVFQYRDLRDPHLQMKTHTIFEHSLAHLRRKENQAAIQKPNRKGKNDSITIQRSVSQEALVWFFFFIILVPQKLRPSRVIFFLDKYLCHSVKGLSSHSYFARALHRG